ncbi:hypothetical protein CRE_12186 [Caenorhabditis remanei]|uniref:Uncharacterized protein n=1 Tax=Caenorhabditis remanei TaxID=31234 RepID=E3N062_CAERE|nr:hypothetical protein CRE_12186 [Caenorhabditis remanei]
MKSVRWNPVIEVMCGEGREEVESGEGEEKEGGGEEGQREEPEEEYEEEEEEDEEEGEKEEGEKEEKGGKRRREKEEDKESDLKPMVEHTFEHARVPTTLGDLFSMSYRGGVFRPIYEETVNSLNKMPIDKLFDVDVSGIPLLAVPNDEANRCVILQGAHRFSSLLSRKLTEEEKKHRILVDVYYIRPGIKTTRVSHVEFHRCQPEMLTLLMCSYRNELNRKEGQFTEREQATNLFKFLKSRISEQQRQDMIDHSHKRKKMYCQLVKEGLVQEPTETAKEQSGLFAFMMNPLTQSSFFRDFEKIPTRNGFHRIIFLASLQNDASCAQLIEELESKRLTKYAFVKRLREITKKKVLENPSNGNNRMMWLKCKTAEEVPRGAIVISHKVIPYPSLLVEKDVTSIVLDPMTKEVLGQLCMFGRSEEIGSGCVAKHSFLASGLALVDGGPIITTTLQRLIHRRSIETPKNEKPQRIINFVLSHTLSLQLSFQNL